MRLSGLSEWYEPLWWVLFFATALPIHMWGGKFFWKFNLWFAIAIFVILIAFFLGNLPNFDFSKSGSVSSADSLTLVSAASGERRMAWC
jgi:hypothetical protein